MTRIRRTLLYVLLSVLLLSLWVGLGPLVRGVAARQALASCEFYGTFYDGNGQPLRGLKFFVTQHSGVVSGNFVMPGSREYQTDNQGRVGFAYVQASVVTISGQHPSFKTPTTITVPSSSRHALASVGDLTVTTPPASLADPDADRILFWDDSAGSMAWLEAGSGLTIAGTTITASGGGSALAAEEDNAAISGATALTTLDFGNGLDGSYASNELDITVDLGEYTGADLPLSAGGTGATLADPGADRILFWDDSAGQATWLDVGAGLQISGTTLSATGSGTASSTVQEDDATVTGAVDVTTFDFGTGFDVTYASQEVDVALDLSEYSAGDLPVAGGGTGAGTAADARTNLGLVIGTNVQAYDADLTTYAGITPSANVQSLLGAADYSAMRTQLSLVIGTNVQAYDADLTTYAGITPAANVQSLLGAADYSAMRTQLGLVIGTNVQAYDADLGVIAGLADPNADRLLFWDDSAGAYVYLTAGSGLSITGTTISTTGGGGSGDVVGPAGATDTAIALFDGTTGQLIKNSVVTIDSSGNIVTAGTITAGSGGAGAGNVVLEEGTQQSLVANSFMIQAPTDVAAGGLSYIVPAAGATGLMFATNSSGDMTISHVSTLSNITSTTAWLPASSDGAALGSGTVMWSDLFVASGAVLNFNNGDVTFTHGSNVVTVAGGTLAVPDDAYAVGWNGSADVPTKNAVYDKIEAIVAGGLPVVDTTSVVEGSGDNTKEVRIEADGITTGTVRVWTAPDANTTIPIFGQIVTFAGPTAARTVTFPDANFTAARTDASNTFTGDQTFAANVLLPSAGVINFDSGDVTITHSANALAFAGVTGDYTFDDTVKPASSDGAALGTATVMWSDLFLASGAVINFNNGNATLTHSAGLLTSNVDIVIPAEAYASGWNGSNEAPTKNDVYDRIEAVTTVYADMLASGTMPDTSGNVFAEPYTIKATNDFWGHANFIFNDTATDDSLYGKFELNTACASGATVTMVWSSTATAGNVRYTLSYRVITADDTNSLDQATAVEAVTITDTAPGAANRRMSATFTPTNSNFATAGTVEWKLTRTGTSGSDTMAAAAQLVALKFSCTP